MFHVSILQKYTPDPAHVEDWAEIIVDTDGTLEEGLVCIMDSQDLVLRHKTVRLVKVLGNTEGWRRQLGNVRTATYPFLFEDEGALSNIWNLNNYGICMSLCVWCV